MKTKVRQKLTVWPIYAPSRRLIRSLSIIGHHSSSNISLSKASIDRNSDSFILNPIAIRCKVLRPGLFVLPLTMFSSVDCFIPARVASLFTVIFFSLHNDKILFVITSEYVKIFHLLDKITIYLPLLLPLFG